MLKKIITRGLLICVILMVALCGYRFITHGSFFAKEVKIVENWETALINSDNYISRDYVPECTKLSNGEMVDEKIYPDLQEMFDAARADGVSITVRSGYRSYEEQKVLWKEEMDRLDEEGLSLHEAIKCGELLVQRPGASEHQTGLAVDINREQGINEKEGLYRWLKENSYKYGFVLRYPEDKTDVTGIANEPWHYRYVGKDAAETMVNENLCLEEFIDAYNR